MGKQYDDIAEKGLFAPEYYGAFRCLADRCRHSCCVDWEICIDAATYEKYKGIPWISDTVTESEDGPCFALCEGGRCPHLAENGLCRIILSHGEDHLSEICRNHPRFFNAVSGGRIEAGLGLVCEEACRLILENDKPFFLCKREELAEAEPTACAFDALPLRDRIISMIEAPEQSFDEKIDAIKEAFGIPELYTPDGWTDRFLLLEILDAEWERTLRSMRGKLLQKSEERCTLYDKYYARLLTYFVYRHVSVAADMEDLRARSGFALLSVAVIRSLFEESLRHTPKSDTSAVPPELIDCARTYSAEIEYSEDNTDELIFAFAGKL